MSSGTIKAIEDRLREIRQAFNSQDLKTFRSYFWTNPKFLHIDHSGRLDQGWGAFEEALDQEFRYLDNVKLSFKNPRIQVFEDKFSSVVLEWNLLQVDPTGQEVETGGHLSMALVLFPGKDWRVVTSHFTSLNQTPGAT